MALRVQENVDLRPHTTFGVGGVAKYFVEVDKMEDAIPAIEFAKKNAINYHILAGGSNVVFNDGLLNFLIIKLKAPKIFSDGDLLNEGAKSYIFESKRVVSCDANLSLMDLINFIILRGLAGLEVLSGIPGSLGGAIFGNAGAYGQTISGPLISAKIFDGKEIREINKESCHFKYRDSVFKTKPWLLLSAKFNFDSGDPETLLKKSKEIIETRNKKYLPGIKCPGSFFKNVLIEDMPMASLKYLPKDRDYYGKVPAWYFLDQVGAKGMQEGGVKVADFHGNLLVNTGGATFKDVWSLAQKLKHLVGERFGIELKEEVMYIGN